MRIALTRQRPLLLTLALLLMPALAACDSDDDDGNVRTATATLSAPDDTTTTVSGTVTFTQLAEGVRIAADVAGLAPGAHGFHLHENGSCARGDHDGDGFAEAGGAAGAHYDPLETGDHGAPDDPIDERHLGDFGNVTAEADSTGSITLTITELDFEDVLDRAVVVHSDEDDLETDPAGNAGDRIGCGVVELGVEG